MAGRGSGSCKRGGVPVARRASGALFGVLVMVAVVAGAGARPVSADTGLTAAVSAAYFGRIEDGSLHAIAHERVAEISACDTCMTHDGRRPGTAEVLGFSSGYPDAVAHMISLWASSPTHDAILSDSGLGRIGCAERAVGAGHYFACVLVAEAGAAAPVAPTNAPVLQLPDTAMP